MLAPDPVKPQPVTYPDLLAAMKSAAEQLAAAADEQPTAAATRNLAVTVANGLAKDFDDLDPEVVCRVALVLAAKVIAPWLAAGFNPGQALNFVSLGAAMHAGHVERPT